MGTLLAIFEPDRTNVGTITLRNDGGVQVVLYSALGKAANDDAAAKGNVGANPLHLYGNTPLGLYHVNEIAPSGPDTRKYGDAGVIRLEPVGGQALLAKQNGRTGLLIQGGSPGTTGLLRRTNGCVRMMNGELRHLIAKIRALQENGGFHRPLGSQGKTSARTRHKRHERAGRRRRSTALIGPQGLK